MNHPNRRKRRSLDEMQRECDAFNRLYKPGQTIHVHPGAITDPPVAVTIVEPAHVLSGHTAVVQVTGGYGCIALDHVDRDPLGVNDTGFPPTPGLDGAVKRVVAGLDAPRHRLTANQLKDNVVDAAREMVRTQYPLVGRGFRAAIGRLMDALDRLDGKS